MPATETTVSDTIPAPIEEVFALLADAQRMPSWLPGCRSVTTKTPIQKGARLRVDFGHGRGATLEIVDFSPPHTLGWVERAGRAGWQTAIRLEFAGGVTRITFQEVRPSRTIASRLLGIFRSNRRATKQIFEAAVQNIRKALTT
jgi:uncharacterized protein YndB with AHSA1/START domain